MGGRGQVIYNYNTGSFDGIEFAPNSAKIRGGGALPKGVPPALYRMCKTGFRQSISGVNLDVVLENTKVF